MITHLDLCVQRLGPLWAVSCFPFEDMNGRMVKLVHGTRHSCMQINFNMSILTSLPLMIHKLQEGDAKDYCKKLRHKYMQLKIAEMLQDGVYSVGDYKSISEPFEWIVGELNRRNVLPHPLFYAVKVFHRLIQGKLLYVSSHYNRGKRVSSYVKYVLNNSTEVGNIVCFAAVKCSCKEPCACLSRYVAIIKRMTTIVPFQTENVSVNHVLQCDVPDVCTDVVNISNLSTVMFSIVVSGILYLSEPLNSFELE
jgi:hypothetical protein